jgi:HEAT repeat protein
MAQLAGREVSTLPPEELLAAFDSAEQHGDVASANKLLDDLATLAEHSARVGRPRAVADILHGLVTREARTSDEEVKQTFLLVIRRLSRPALMRGVAGLIAKHPERKQHCYEVLLRTGEDGAEAVIEQVGQSRSMEERQSMLDVLVELPDAVPALIRMLGDARWFVVRNAADLLGELAATRAESALVALLKHADDRVRRSATNALLKLGTTGAVKGVYDAVGDSSPEVRMQVAASIASRKDAKTSVTLIKAIDGEEDGEVQLALIAALGKVATPDAVQKLVKMAEPAGGIFKKKDATLRVAAVQALVEARTPAALAALKELAADKEREVRETATRALAQLGQ